jgi:hypothetical protein
MAHTEQQQPRAVARIVGALNRITVALAVSGVGLLLAGLATIPLLGYTAATIGAVGTWSLSLGALTACLWLVASAAHRVRTGRWYWGEPPQQAFSKVGWLLLGIGAIGAVVVVIAFDYLS